MDECSLHPGAAVQSGNGGTCRARCAHQDHRVARVAQVDQVTAERKVAGKFRCNEERSTLFVHDVGECLPRRHLPPRLLAVAGIGRACAEDRRARQCHAECGQRAGRLVRTGEGAARGEEDAQLTRGPSQLRRTAGRTPRLLALLRGELHARGRLARTHGGGVTAPAEVLAGGAGGTSGRWAAVRIFVRCGTLPTPRRDPQRLTAGAAASTPTAVELRADLLQQLCDRKLETAHARRAQRKCDLPLGKLIRCVHDAARTVTRPRRCKRGALGAQIEDERSLCSQRGDRASRSRVTKVRRHDPSLSALRAHYSSDPASSLSGRNASSAVFSGGSAVTRSTSGFSSS